jgi:hypothetical protein
MMAKIEERDLWVTEPESLTVGQLNEVVRRLRDEVHYAKIRAQNVERPDLKRILMELGNAMVLEHSFRPAIGDRHGSVGYHTECIRCFTEWVNYHPEAIEELKKLGFDWSM